MERTEMERMKELRDILNQASLEYYQNNSEIMSNYEYDKLYDELQMLEKKTGVVLAGSPTMRVGYELLSQLPREAHESPMLSLDKTKNVEDLADWLGDQEGLLSWKMDGLTIVLTYQGGQLVKALTRGNGETGEVVTNNAKVFQNLPLRIPYQGELILRGEAVIRYSDFNRINHQITDVEEKYKNPRNLCSGSVRQLNNEVTAQRKVRFYAFSLVRAEGVDFENSREKQFLWLKEQGFDVVYYEKVNRETLPGVVVNFAGMVLDNDLPSDGLVLLMDNIAYGESLGRTAKFPRNAMAFKWADELGETRLDHIEWSPSRTGLINPVAVFDPVVLEGTTVSRASVHNISIMEALELGENDRITVYKANMIIPQIAENLTRSGLAPIPETCPICGGTTEIHQNNGVKSLYCTNPECEAKKIKSFALFVSRDALNVEGLSEATLEKFIGAGLIHSFADIFRLDRHEETIMEMEGFGKKSFDKLVESAERARKTTLARLLYGIGIAGIGAANAKVISKAFEYDPERVRHGTYDEFVAVEGIGPILAEGIVEYFSREKNQKIFTELLSVLELEKPQEEEKKPGFEGKIFVITGSLEHFSNRKEAQARIESVGGKVTSSVTGKTDYLINNDIQSGSSKNKKARELGIPIISEEEFLRMLGENPSEQE
ncbi:MAG: NAD-dependent DNA ligase LigA [Clostridiales bacterium]|nr:NAD-dependent DNA ligase LigA [Clostridiales bacterium]